MTIAVDVGNVVCAGSGTAGSYALRVGRRASDGRMCVFSGVVSSNDYMTS